MVLQQDSVTSLYGYSRDAESIITLTINDLESYSGIASSTKAAHGGNSDEFDSASHCLKNYARILLESRHSCKERWFHSVLH